MLEVKKWVEQLKLLPHPEGGFYKEVYRSKQELDLRQLHNNLEGKRNLCTGIYFLIEKNNYSAFHRIKSDEIWHFYAGDPLVIHMIDKKGSYSKQQMGRDIEQGEKLQFVVEAGVWFASEVAEGGSYSLVGCTVSFGFDFRDFELADKKLLELAPDHKEIIKQLLPN